MAIRRRLVGAAATTVLGLAGVFASAAPANADSRHIGNYGLEDRCYYNGYDLCLYWWHGMDTGAYWGTNHNNRDLYNNRFFRGTGRGSGQVVKNNATAMACGPFVENRCYSYYNSGYRGSYDWEHPMEIGTLYYTWNENASVRIT